MEPSDLARIGYEAYAKHTGGKTFDGRDMPDWSDLPPRTVLAWRAAAMVIQDAAEKAQLEALGLDRPGALDDLAATR